MSSQRLGKIAIIAAICGTLAWQGLMAVSPRQPDAAHPDRYVHRHDVRYVSATTDLVLQILLGSSFALALIALACRVSARGDGQ